jgi:AraC family transcriptional regulator
VPSPEWIGRVNRAMDHARDDPGADLSVEALARLVHSSPYHFHRIFREVRGEPLAAFVRRVRLERAAYLMKSRPDRSLTSIATSVGFSSLSQFSRTFRRTYGIAPSRWDRKSRPPSSDDSDLCRPPDWPGELEARVVHHPAVRLAYVRTRTVFGVADLERGFHRLTASLERRKVPWRDCPMVGMSWDNYETTPLDRVHYDLAFVVPPDVGRDGEIGIRDLPELTAVEVHCQGPMLSIARAWDYLYDVWFPRSSRQPAHFPAMKRFRKRPDELDWATWDLDCSIAIEDAEP